MHRDAGAGWEKRGLYVSIWVYLCVTLLYLYTPVLWGPKHPLCSDCTQVIIGLVVIVGVGDGMAARGQGNT